MQTEGNPLLANDEVLENVRRRVQQKLAGRFLDAMGTESDASEENKTEKSLLSQNMDEETRKEFEKKFGKYRSKDSPYSIQNILWLISSIAVFYYTDFYIACRYDQRVNRVWFNVGAILMLVNLSIAAFLIVYITYIKKVSTDNWETLYPAAIPIATGSFILGGICVTVGLWPIWSIFTPVILFTLFMGMIVTIAMLPNF
ncbi:transmembrane protein 128-like [Saccostrea echinata]|uniref:transmembrane protein 128-like n=1 Tax=Saccostrea echinata TaxID=191078 RepID=UPI002A80708A|nr:transmembrane protein 128-like [Saccostrea echinata]